MLSNQYLIIPLCDSPAIVGEASTGKSTFINALLREELLAAQALTMTTAAATVIMQGSALEAVFRFPAATIGSNRLLSHLASGYKKDRDPPFRGSYLPFTEMAAREGSGDPKWIWLDSLDEPIVLPPGLLQHGAVDPVGDPGQWMQSDGTDSEAGVQSTLSLRQLIGLFTTTEEVASTLVGMTVTHSAEFLKDGVCVIDTPGADATNMRHAQVTREAVAKCDAAILITPAGLSHWTLDKERRGRKNRSLTYS